MKYLKAVLITITGLILVNCSHRPSIDRDMSPREQAIELTKNNSARDVASGLVEWMSHASINDRDYAKALTVEIVSIYDSIGHDSAREFLYAIDSVKERLPNDRLARVYVVATGPWRLGVILREGNAPEELVRAVEKEYSSDSISLQYFQKAYNIN